MGWRVWEAPDSAVARLASGVVVAVVCGHVNVLVAQVLTSREHPDVRACNAATAGDEGEPCLRAYRWVKASGEDLPKLVTLHMRLVDAAIAAGDIEDALRLTRAATREFPGEKQVFLRLGDMLLGQRAAHFEAYGPLLQATKLDPRDGHAKRLLADALVGMGWHADALAEYRQARRLTGTTWEIGMGLASAYMALGQPDHALRALQTIGVVERTHEMAAVSRKFRGDVLMALRRPGDALSEYRKAGASAQVDPREQIEASCGAVKALVALGRATEARAECKATRSSKFGARCTCEQ